MSKYIGSSAVNLSTTSADVTGNADIDGNLTVGGNLTVSGTTITVDHATAQTVDLGDGDKIRLGADYELQLWSDGTTGQISGDFNHTGSITTDGLTVDGTGTIDLTSDSGTTLKLSRDGSAGQIASIIMQDGGDAQNRINSSGGALEFEYGASNLNALKISNNGDINFYATDGTTQAFHWDAADERLGIGVTNPAQLLHVQAGSTGNGTIRVGGGAGLEISHDNSASTVQRIDSLYRTTSNDTNLQLRTGTLTFHTGTSSSERMRIDYSGSLITKGAAVFNEDGADKDFRVESGTNPYALFMDAANSRVSINTSGFGTGSFNVNGTTMLGHSGIVSSQGNAALILRDNDSTNMRANFIVEDNINTNRGGLMIQATEVGVTNDRDIYLQPHGGRVGMKTQTPQYPVDVSGTFAVRNGSIMLGRDTGSATGGIHMYNPAASPNQLRIYDDTGLWGGSGGANNTEIQVYGGSAYNVKLNGANGLSFDAGSNWLDDYEEGNHEITFNQGAISINSSYDEAFYTKIGRSVTVSGLVLVSSAGDSNVLKVNMPFTAASKTGNQTDFFVGTTMGYNVSTGTGGLYCVVRTTDNRLEFFRTVNNGTWANITGNELAAGDHLYFTITYQTA